jgi:hypothetical protein
MKKAWVLFLSMLLLDYAAILNGAVPRSDRDAIDFDEGIGLVAGTQSGQFCLSIKNGNLKPGQELTLLWIPIADRKQTPEIQSTTVLKLLTNPCDPINSVVGDAAYVVNAGNLIRIKSILPSSENALTSGSFRERAKSKWTCPPA